MKGGLTLFMLETIQLSAATAGEISDMLTYYGKTAHYERLRHIYRKLPERKLLFQKQIELLKDDRRFSKLVSTLKAQGLVAEDQIKKCLILTSKGTDKIENLRDTALSNFYSFKETKELKIVLFDIPEKESAHRAWLREVLKNLKFTMLQKSVWVGNSSLPEEFMNDLRARGIDKFVEILAVTKSGTLRQIKD